MEHTVTYLLMVQKFANLKQKILGNILKGMSREQKHVQETCQ